MLRHKNDDALSDDCFLNKVTVNIISPFFFLVKNIFDLNEISNFFAFNFSQFFR